MKTLYIIGNGFDRFNNLPTSYWDFHEWLIKNGHSSFVESLEMFFEEIDANGKSLLWSDFERALGRFDIEKSFDLMTSQSAEIRNEVEKYISELSDNINIHFSEPLRRQMSQYFVEWVHSINEEIYRRPTISTAPYGIKYFAKDGLFLTFNYTETLEFTFGVPENQICHVHNRVKDDEIPIVGHNTKKIKIEFPISIMKGESDEKQAMAEVIDGLRKDHSLLMNKRKKFFDMITPEIKHVVVYGHSISEIDMPYFEFIKAHVNETAHWSISCYNSDEIRGLNRVVKYLNIAPNLLDYFRMDNSSKKSVSQTRNEDQDELQLDKQTLTNLFSYFSTNVMDNYLRQEPTDIDTRVTTIKDYWDIIINASSFVIYNAETDRLIRDFYNPFAAIISDGGMDYGPNEMNPHLYRFWGYKHDSFTTTEREKKYYEYVNRIRKLAPLYTAMIDHIKKVYKLDLASLSGNFEKENKY